MTERFGIEYNFVFSDGKSKKFLVTIDEQTLALVPDENDAPPAWTELGVQQCANCPLKTEAVRHCPVALNMAGIVEYFKDSFSYESVAVTVVTTERSYYKNTSLQEGLSSMIGIVMVTSGCPVMESLKPMVRFHLPFATLQETVYRMASMFLMAQYFRNRRGLPADWTLNGLANVYGSVGLVNRGFADRLREAAKRDANINALLNLHCFAEMIPMMAEKMLEQIEHYFASYLGDV